MITFGHISGEIQSGDLPFDNHEPEDHSWIPSISVDQLQNCKTFAPYLSSSSLIGRLILLVENYSYNPSYATFPTISGVALGAIMAIVKPKHLPQTMLSLAILAMSNIAFYEVACKEYEELKANETQIIERIYFHYVTNLPQYPDIY